MTGYPEVIGQFPVCRRSGQGRTCRFPTKVQLVFAASHAAAVKQTVITIANTTGTIKKYLQLKIVTAAKQMPSAHARPRTRAKRSAARPPNYHANTAANTLHTERSVPPTTYKAN